MKATFFTKYISVLFSKRTLMFLFFLVIAFVAWFINRLSNEYRSQLSLNICIYSSVNEKTPRLCADEIVPITARATGFYILRQRLSEPAVVYVDIRNQKMRQQGSRYYMLTSSLQNDITTLLSDDMHVESYGKDTIFFHGASGEKIPEQGVIYGGEILSPPQ